MKNKKDYIKELALKIKSLGYNVYLSESETYGFFTDNKEEKLISFQIDYFWFNFGSNHISKGLGSGHRITSDEKYLLWDIENFCTPEFLSEIFNCKPYFADKRKGEEFIRWTSLSEHFEKYQSSSKYSKI